MNNKLNYNAVIDVIHHFAYDKIDKYGYDITNILQITHEIFIEFKNVIGFENIEFETIKKINSMNKLIHDEYLFCIENDKENAKENGK